MKNQSLINKQIQEVLKDFQRPEETFVQKFIFNSILALSMAAAALGALGMSPMLFVWAMAAVVVTTSTRSILLATREKEYKAQVAEARLAYILSVSNEKSKPQEEFQPEIRKEKSTPKNIRIEPTIDMNNLLTEDRLH